MSLLGCIEIGQLIERKAAGLDDAQRLRLEQHLQGCESCRQTADFLQTFDQLSDAVPALGDRRTEEILKAALVAFEYQSKSRPAPRRAALQRMAGLGIGFAMTATAILAIFVSDANRGGTGFSSARDGHSGPEQRREETGQIFSGKRLPLPVGRLEEGRLALVGSDEPVRGDLPLGLPVRALVRSRISLAGVQAILQPEARVRWQPHTLTLALDVGQLRISSGPAPHPPLRVVASALEIRSQGASFDTDGESVICNTGRIEVFSSSGHALGVLGPGESLRVAAAVEASNAGLGGALAALRSGQPDEALAQLERTRATRLSGRTVGPELAAAELLTAQIMLAVGDAAGARNAVARALRATSWGTENERAIFFGASLVQETEPTEAATLFRRYLKHYPGGYYGPEIRRRIRAIGTPVRVPTRNQALL